MPHVGGQLEQRLNSAFAVRRGVAHDQSAPIILQGAGKNLRRGSAEPAGQNHQRAIVKNTRVRVFIHDDGAVGIFDLHDRSFFDEQTSQADGLFERAAAIAAQVQNDAADVLLAKLAQETCHVGGGALRVAALATFQLETRIK